LILASLLVTASQAALAVPFAVEGKLAAISATGTSGTLTCNGVPIVFDGATVFSTPSGTKPLSDMLSPVPFPARDPVGPSDASAFIGGTCIVDGEDNLTTRMASSVFLEVAENVLVGPTTNVPGQTSFAIMGVEIVLLQNKDPVKEGYDSVGRVIAGPVMNGFGQEVKLDTVPAGDESSAEGYMGKDGKFYASLVETTAGDPANPIPTPTATVVRGDLTFSNATTYKLDIRGGCTFPEPRKPTDPARSQAVLVVVDRTTVSNGVSTTAWVNPSSPTTPINDSPTSATSNATCLEDIVVSPGNGTYRYRNDRYTGPAPTKVRVRVSPTATFPVTQYSADVILNRIGFK
jgi:hypothetical protein